MFVDSSAITQEVITGAQRALILLNGYAFLLMAIDKYQATKGLWRVPERRLLRASACFGSLGTILGMFLLRHKTRKKHFRTTVFIWFFVQAALLTVAYFVLTSK